MSSNRPTLADVAREAGVSLMTVSRVVNCKEGVGQKQRQRIEAIIERMGYRPSGIARSLITQRTNAIGLIVPDISNPFFPDVAHGVEQLAFEQGYSLLLCNTEEDSQRELSVLELLFEKQVDGLILCSSRLETHELKAALPKQTASVLVNHPFEPEKVSPLVGAVLLDDFVGGRKLAAHLLARGHQKIGFLSGPAHSFSGRTRLAGAHEIFFDDALIQSNCAPTVAGGEQAARKLLNAHPQITALMCFNDLVAVGALQAAAELDRSVPNDLAVTGYDDIQLAALVTPSLTTCRVPREELGRCAAQQLFEYLADSSQEPQVSTISAKMLIRASAP